MNAKLRFGEYELNAARYELSRHGRPIRLERIPMEMLLLLLERRPDLVPRNEILATLWGKDVNVDADNAINTAISKIRTALRDSAEGIVFIKTVPAKGYRFIAPVTIVAEEPEASTEMAATTPPMQPASSRVDDELPVASMETLSPTAETGSRAWIWWLVAAAVLALALGGWVARNSIRDALTGSRLQPSALPEIRGPLESNGTGPLARRLGRAYDPGPSDSASANAAQLLAAAEMN
jgi:DNA-binding winged helix-turn-helix (wHTH) protein